MALDARRELRALEVLAENEGITQRGLASKLGIALGLTNLYVKRLARKGFTGLSGSPGHIRSGGSDATRASVPSAMRNAS